MTTPLLPALFIGGHEFSIAELSAARLDGDLVVVGAAFAAAGTPVDHRHRAAAIAADVPPGCTVVGRSAAWLHSGSGEVPLPLEIGVSGPTSRWSRPHRSARSMRIRPEHREIVGIGTAAVLTLSPVATIIDLARMPRRRGDDALLRAVASRRGIPAADVLSALDDWAHLPGKREAEARLRTCFELSRR
ncbi:hypothetical protein ELQ90_06250 [Labedella phragmitis]|uniref:AbiEi antitoxin C-terminal domain-containing protein n=1 Tax=Labedella phragmitis TaxID=2498849 RepID=A0A444PUZ3_9MICO|nr:hypothetical protein [Labedella phragmitis]RWZ51695.1 hypothetical protein ELQ90_06250 [Labedella phragmitis]